MLSAIAALSMAFATTTATAPPVYAAADSFYAYQGGAPLSGMEPGTILDTRTLTYHVAGISTPITAIQLLYRTTDAQYRASANVTSILLPPGGVDPSKAIAYQSFYDSLDPEHGPSRAIAGDVSFGGLVNTSETVLLADILARGYTVIVADTEGQRANFAAGPEYGMNTLDSIRAAVNSPATGLNSETRFGLVGYSGGAIATNWAAALAPDYAPEINARIVGATQGGLLVNPARNLRYVSGSVGWSGVAPMAIIGVARSYDLDFTPYLSPYGAQVAAALRSASIANVLFQYPGLTWQQLVKPEYADPNNVAVLVDTVDQVNLGYAPTPTVPLYIAQGGGGFLEGTDGSLPGIGAGDGVMVAGDVRTLARQYCATGNPRIEYVQYDALSHVGTMGAWMTGAVSWIDDRFAGIPAGSNCWAIPEGNSLTSGL
ncbi:triacylglycerol lipase [Nocardia sp. 2]|uniref:Triacylglycerol lipase n=1 Tax=Nocardia acididurans TaxID=2802282 RepID=A0ABS1MCG1_9NOCA|nr:lipase family protein [Nocardia acididurans]MBL1078331.1 triacylglycerol lipase [Nocardia acididurans]